MEMAGRILNFGSLNIDYVYTVEHIARNGETVASLDYQVFPGGKGLNQSAALARAGAKVFHAGRIGKEGVFLKEALEAEGIDCRYLEVDDGATGHAIIQRSVEGDNCIVLYPGANHRITREAVDRVLQHFDENDILVCQNEISQVDYLIEAAFRRGMRIAWNPSPVTDVISRVDCSMITWLVINEIEGQSITGKAGPQEILAELKQRYPQLTVVLTLGEAGSVCQWEDGLVRQSIFRVPVKDTTAAGDTFLGYLIAMTTEGPEHQSAPEWQKLLETASMASAIAVSKEGAMPSIPYREEVMKKLASTICLSE